MFERNHPAYSRLGKVGQDITKSVGMKAVVVFSAHWQATHPGTVEINVAGETDLIYEQVISCPCSFLALRYEKELMMMMVRSSGTHLGLTTLLFRLYDAS